MTGSVTYELPEIIDLNTGDIYEVIVKDGLDQSFMKYSSESNSITIDKEAVQFGKYEIEFLIVDN